MNTTLEIITIVICLVIILLILVQGRGSGLGSAWGGGGESFQSRRGIEKWIIRATWGAILILFIITLVGLVL